MSRREFLEILRSQLSGQMSQGKAAAHVRYYEDYIQSQVRSGRDEQQVYDESGYTEESYGADDYADSSAGSTTGRTRSYKLDLSTWYGKAIVIAVAVVIVILLTTVLVAVAPFLITFGVILYLISWFRKRKA